MEEDFITLADKSLQTILIFQDNRIVYSNPASWAMFGYTSEELEAMLPEQFLALVHPPDRATSDERARKRLAGEDVVPEFEVRIVRKDGLVRWVQSFNNPIDFKGRRAYLSTSIDITERKQAESALRDRERQLQHVVASSPAVLFMLRPEGGRFTGFGWMSDNIESVLGYTAAETLGSEWWLSNVHPQDRDAILDQFVSDMRSRGYNSSEYRFRHRDGHYVWIRGEARLLRDSAGQPVEVVGSISDITERKRLEDQFRQAQKMEAVGLFAGGVAHDFNNLMTIISGYGQMLLRGLPPGDPKRDMVSQLLQAGDRAAKLTRQLLAFSRQTVLEPKVLNLNEVIRENETMLKRLIGEDVQLTTILDPGLEPVKVDPNQFVQVIMNLATNGRDAMPKGGKLTIETANVTLDEISAALVPEAKPGYYVLLTVRDNGTGMTPEVRARIFEPFFTTKAPGKGSGLGLATVYGIVKQSGGFACVESEPGRGTTFKIYFAVVKERIRTSSSTTPALSVARGGETILLVEDEDEVRSMVRIMLEQAGYTVLQANGASEALRIATEHAGPIHALVTDVVMPKVSGRELVETLIRRRPDVKVLYMSGYTDDTIVRHGVLQAEVAFLQKPFTAEALTNKVRELLDAKS